MHGCIRGMAGCEGHATTAMELVASAARVQKERLRLGLTQAQLAERLGVHERTIARWELGLFSPHPIYLRRMSEMQPEAAPAVQSQEVE